MNNKKTSWFCKTQCEYVAKELTEAGYQLIDHSNGVWTFINKTDYPIIFDEKKVTYSDKLCF